MSAQYRVQQVSFNPEKWELSQWTDAGWTYLGVYSTESAATSAVNALVPRPLPPPSYFDVASQSAVPDVAQTDEIKGV